MRFDTVVLLVLVDGDAKLDRKTFLGIGSLVSLLTPSSCEASNCLLDFLRLDSARLRSVLFVNVE